VDAVVSSPPAYHPSQSASHRFPKCIRQFRLSQCHSGLDLIGNYQSALENVDEDIAVAGCGFHKVEVDLMQPLDPDKKPSVQHPPLNHVGLWVDDLPAAVAWLQARGVRFAPGGTRKGASGFEVCFIHPKGNEESPIGGEGVLIELVQAPPEVRETSDRLE
jgi:lactoylglutathione lyase